MNKKAATGFEFIIAVTFFLIAFWYIFLQTSEMFTTKDVQEDMRQPILQFYSGYIIKNPGDHPNWTTSPSDFGLALYKNGRAYPNILSKEKLDYANSVNCSSIRPKLFAGLDFGFKVTSQYGEWECNNPPKKSILIKRFIYIYFENNSYQPGVLEAWAT